MHCNLQFECFTGTPAAEAFQEAHTQPAQDFTPVSAPLASLTDLGHFPADTQMHIKLTLT